MEITPGRAPFTEDEDYTPLRKPKSAANTPTHSNSNSFNASYNSQASSSGGSSSYQQATILPTKLSPYAAEFTPSNVHDRLKQQQRYQQQHNRQTYSQYQDPQHHQQHHSHHNQHHHQHQQHHHHHQQQHQQQQHQHQRYTNGYQMPQHHNPHHQQHQYVPQMASLTGSVQERLKISSPNSSSNNYSSSSSSSSKNNYNNYNNRQRQHQPYQNHGAAAAAAAPQNSAVEVETIALDYLQTVIQCLNQNPGQFDTVATRFLTIFDGMESNEYVLSNAMEDIFQESIQNPNFRYMGAKLYNLLHMLNLKKDSLFHTLLKCKLDYHQLELSQCMEQTGKQQTVRETALFLAELYMQLRGDDSRINLIAENIVFALKQLLCKESPDNVRCICLTLKLAGYDLTSDCPQDMHLIIEQLGIINSRQPGKYPLAANVISLQKNNWGRKLSSSNSMCEEESEKLKKPEPLRTSDEPIFYGPDGRELTAEESDFLTSNVGGSGGVAGAGSTDDEDGHDLDIDLDPEMDEETEKAYIEFCKLNATS